MKALPTKARATHQTSRGRLQALLLFLSAICILLPRSVRAEPKVEAKAELEVKATRSNIEAKPVTPKVSVKPTKTRALPTGENKTGVSTQSISVPKGSGTIEGMGESFSAQASTGIATFAVPFALPAARGDAQPALGLTYSSSNGSGEAGVGWGIGVPFIARETDRGLPSYDDQSTWHANQDRFVYNGGQELVPVTELLEGEQLPSWAESGWQYFRPRVEGSYVRFFWNPSLRLWRVQDKAGVVLELGVVGDEQDAIEVDPTDATKVFRWYLKRQIDPHGNEIRYYYDRFDGNRRYLTDILYTAPPVAKGPVPREAWAYRVFLDYEQRGDVSQSYRRGWQTVERWRLSSVTVSAKDVDPAGPRRLVRKYNLGYVPGSHLSLLSWVQAEGRCGEAEPGERCTLPKMRFRYTHVQTDGNDDPVFDDGFEVIDDTVTTITNSPKHSVNEDYTDLYDVNSDGLPDVVTMMPGYYNGEHGLWLQGRDRFGPQQLMGLRGVLNATTSEITKHNPNLVSLDVDGDAIIDLLHMPKVQTYSVYTPLLEGGKWWWDGRVVTTADDLDARIDFSGDADDIRVFDVNGDGLVDVVKTAGTALQVWFALGRYPNGDGRFGSATWTGPGTATLSMEPVMRCLPWSATGIRFSDSDIKLGDMNGDGLTDVVRVRQGDVKYWPGRGDGSFGTGSLGCEGGTFGQNTFVQMDNGPWTTNTEGLRVDDVNGDGLADLIQVRFQDVDIWYNESGTAFGERRWLHDTPASPDYQNRVRIVDMNGSGTADVLWGDGHAYKYIDLSGGKRPWLLRRIDNGMGRTTEVGYATTTSQMLNAASVGAPWSKTSPVVQHVVERVTVRDNLDKVGRPQGIHVTEYSYRDPVFDGLQREFRGFSKTTVRSVGDTNSPTSEAVSEFLLGERRATGPYNEGNDLTLKANRWRDNPYEALKGLPTLSESRAADTGVYLSSSATTYALRKLYTGADGRGVYAAFAKQGDTWLYDTGDFQPSSTAAAPVDQLREQQVGDALIVPSVQPRAIAGTRHVASDVTVDRFGNRMTATAYGVVGTDEQITSHTEPGLIDQSGHELGEGHWAWRTVRTWMTGSEHLGERNETEVDYDGFGDPTTTRAYLTGVGALDRAVPASLPSVRPPEFEGWITTGRTHYDELGNTIFVSGPEGRCGAVTYDPAFRHLPGVEVVYAGQSNQTVEVGGETYTCGERMLAATATYDRGLQLPLVVVDINNAKTTARYDVMGRVMEVYRPRPDPANHVLPLPSVKLEYHLPDDDGNPPYSRLVTYAQDGSTEDEDAYHGTHGFVDGMGRIIVTLSEADDQVDGFRWVVQGLTEYDAKGAEQRKYLAWSWNGSAPASFPLSEPAAAQYGRQRYDAFGRSIQTYGLDGTVTLYTRYHALSVDAWDAEDLGPGPHQGTYASEVKDGHGRVVRSTARERQGQAIEQHHVNTAYLPTGEPERITRTGGGTPTSRTMAYDSIGRMITNTDVNTGTWRYVYNDASDLVGTSDARGCGVNFSYDAAGRLLGEDYAPCDTDHHAAYSPSVDEVSYRYDEPDPDADAFEACPTNSLNGRLVSVVDRGGKAMTCYDQRGRAVEVARRITAPDGILTEPWYRKRAAYDAADRPTTETTGAQVNVPTGVTSSVTTSYTQGGSVLQVTSPYGTLVQSLGHDAEGLIKEIVYGDAAHTTTAFGYDDLRRLRNLTTYRANQGTWTNADFTQQMLLQDEQITYDRVGNPTEIRDWRDPSEWPEGAKPVSRKMAYDDLYRLIRIDYQYPDGADDWTDPYAAEQATPGPASPRADFAGRHRPMRQTFRYDWLGNTVETGDEAQAFFDRSLGQITNDTYQLKTATGANGELEASYL